MIEDVIRVIVANECRAANAPLVAEVAALRRRLDERLPARLVTRGEAAKARHCSVDTSDREIAAGLLPVIPESAVGELLLEQFRPDLVGNPACMRPDKGMAKKRKAAPPKRKGPRTRRTAWTRIKRLLFSSNPWDCLAKALGVAMRVAEIVARLTK